MPSPIQLLPDHIASKIAAGEVVQRPESVVKELLENALDAGAKNVTLILRDAGRTLIQVIDDGSGIARDDATLAFARHATSKISSYEDLERLITYGFRGEALSSIASVAHVELRTRTASEDLGTLLKVEGGKIISQENIACDVGTSIAVRHLFFNTPARRAFLKSDATELRHTIDAFERSALAHPEVHMICASDDETLYDFREGTMEERVQALVGDSAMKAMLPTHKKAEAMSISGFIGKPNFARKTKAQQYLFLNKRPIINKSIQYGVYSAYEHLIDKQDYPQFVLYLDVDPAKVDVNVHPQKLEVKFTDDRPIYQLVQGAVREALAQFDLTPHVGLPDSLNTSQDKTSFRYQNPVNVGEELQMRTTVTREGLSNDRYDTGTSRQTSTTTDEESRDARVFIESLFGETSSAPTPETQSSRTDREGIVRAPGLWQLHNKYILAHIQSGLMIIDQHVAHERILYEKMRTSLERNTPFVQQLLFPQTIELPQQDAALVHELSDELLRMGFSMKPFGKNTVVIEGVPQDVRPGQEETILQEIIDQYKEYSRTTTLEQRENLAASFGCRAAIKAGDRLTQEEMRSLIDQLFATEMPYVCPHGRPIIVKLALDELDRRFGRTS